MLIKDQSRSRYQSHTPVCCYVTFSSVMLAICALTWYYAQSYDTSGTLLSFVAAILTSIALAGSILELCMQAVRTCMFNWDNTGYNGEIQCCCCKCRGSCGLVLILLVPECCCCCCKCIRSCCLGLIFFLSFGALQLASGALLVKSLLDNTGNARLFAGFMAAIDFLVAICCIYWIWNKLRHHNCPSFNIVFVNT